MQISPSTAPNSDAYTTDSAIEPDWSIASTMSRWMLWFRRAYPANRTGRSLPARREVLEVGPDRSVPVDVRVPRSSGPASPVERAGHGRPGALGRRASSSATTRPTTSRAVLFVSSGITSLSASNVLTRCTSGSTAPQQLRLRQHPRDAEPLDRVPLHHLDDGAREVLPDVTQPPRHPRRRRTQPGR